MNIAWWHRFSAPTGGADLGGELLGVALERRRGGSHELADHRVHRGTPGYLLMRGLSAACRAM